jgi:hypothetical protein
MRELYKDTTCCYCKQDLPEIIFTKDRKRTWDSFDLKTMKKLSDYNIYIEADDEAIEKKISMLVSYRCPTCVHLPPFRVLPDLLAHVSKEHSLYYCNMCLKHNKIFPSEQKLYSKKQLTNHMQFGDIVPGAGGGGGGGKGRSKKSKGHPVCKFCSIPHYDNDHLYQHLTYQHFQCHLCQSNGPDYEYFNTYGDLEQHFRDQHYLCPEQSCLEKKFVVFDNTIGLKNHMVQVHKQTKMGKLDKEELANLITFQSTSATRQLRYSDSPPPSSPSPPPVDEDPFPTLGGGGESRRGGVQAGSGVGSNPAAESRRSEPEFSYEDRRMSKEEEKKEKNRQLGMKLREMLGPELFSEFKMLSKEFQQGHMTARQYYMILKRTFQAELNSVFDQLVSLIPDYRQQGELRALRTEELAFPDLGAPVSSSHHAQQRMSYNVISSGGRGSTPPSFPSYSSSSSSSSSSIF